MALGFPRQTLLSADFRRCRDLLLFLSASDALHSLPAGFVRRDVFCFSSRPPPPKVVSIFPRVTVVEKLSIFFVSSLPPAPTCFVDELCCLFLIDRLVSLPVAPPLPTFPSVVLAGRLSATPAVVVVVVVSRHPAVVASVSAGPAFLRCGFGDLDVW